MFGVPGAPATDDFDGGGRQAGLNGEGFGQPRSDERAVGDDAPMLGLIAGFLSGDLVTPCPIGLSQDSNSPIYTSAPSP
jgi:hypothetical protein